MKIKIAETDLSGLAWKSTNTEGVEKVTLEGDREAGGFSFGNEGGLQYYGYLTVYRRPVGSVNAKPPTAKAAAAAANAKVAALEGQLAQMLEVMKAMQAAQAAAAPASGRKGK